MARRRKCLIRKTISAPILDPVTRLQPVWRHSRGQAAAGDLANFADGGAAIRKKRERGTTGTQSLGVGWKEFDRVPRPPKTVDTRSR